MRTFLWFKSLAVVVLVMIAASTHADTRIWVQAGKPSGFSSFEAAMQERGWMRGGAIASEGLATVACYHAAQTGVNKTPECAKQFLDRNNVQGEVVSISDFFARSNGEGWWIPHDPSVVSAQAAAVQPVGETPSLATPPVADVTAVKAQLQQLQSLVSQAPQGKQVAELQQAIAGLTTKMAEMEKSLGSVSLMQEVQQGLQIGLANLEEGVLTEALIKSIGQQVTAAQAQLTTEWQAAFRAELAAEMKNLKADSALGYGLVAKLSPEAASQYAQHSTAIYAAVIALAFGIGLILLSVLHGRQKKTAAMVRKHDHILHDQDGVLDRLAGVENGLHEVRLETYALQAAVVDSVTLADEAHQVAVATQKDVVRFDDENPGLETLPHLPLTYEQAVEWTGSYCGKRFAVKIWRDDATPMGQVQTNVLRNVESGQLAEPLALKRLRQRIEAAVISGRVPLTDAVKKVA